MTVERGLPVPQAVVHGLPPDRRHWRLLTVVQQHGSQQAHAVSQYLLPISCVLYCMAAKDNQEESQPVQHPVRN